MFEPDTGQSLEDQVRRAIRLGDAGTDQTQASDAGRGLTGLFHGDRKHAGTLQGFPEHLPVAGLKNTKGQQVVGKKDRLGQDHHPNLFR